MLPYLFVFFFSILFTFLAQVVEKRNNGKALFYVFSAVAVLLPALLAGFRDSGVGTDTKIYVDNVWSQIRRVRDFSDFLHKYGAGHFKDIEFIYLLLNYVASWFGRSVGLIYFLANFVVVLLIYITAYQNRNRVAMWLVMFIFLFGYYNQSLNLVRQTIALAIGVYSFQYLENKKWIKFIIALIFIRLAHNTGIFYLGFAGAYWIAVRNYRSKSLVLILTLLSSIFLFIYFDIIIGFLVVSGILPVKFLYYMSGDTIDYTSQFIYHFLLGVILFVIYFMHRNSEEKDNLLSYSYVNLLGAILILTAFISVWSFRVAFYFLFICDILFLPRALHWLNKKHKIEYIVMITAVLSLVAVFWYKVYIVNNDNDTYPYKSEVLGF